MSSVSQNSPVNPLSANPTKWSNTLKQFVSKLPTNCLSAFDHFVKLVLKGLKKRKKEVILTELVTKDPKVQTAILCKLAPLNFLKISKYLKEHLC